MKSTLLVVAVASALLLSACAPMRPGGPLPFDRMNPKVYIVGKGYIVVDQEPIVFLKGERGRITWHLQDAGYRFDPKIGISSVKPLTGKHNDIRDCRVDSKDDRIFSCQNDNNGSETYKYSIVVRRRSDNAQYTLDPLIAND